MQIPIEISARHCHLCKKDLEELFGEGYQLRPLKQLSQKGQYAAEETVDVKSDEGEIKNVRILGPLREVTQVELSKTDARALNIDPPIAECTKIGEDIVPAEVEIVGPKTAIQRVAVIIAHRHIHMDPATAEQMGIKDDDLVSVKVGGERLLTFHNVLVRIHPDYRLMMQVDTDEANAAGIQSGTTGEIVKPS